MCDWATHVQTGVQQSYVGDGPVGAAAGPRVHPAQPSWGQRSQSKSNNTNGVWACEGKSAREISFEKVARMCVFVLKENCSYQCQRFGDYK